MKRQSFPSQFVGGLTDAVAIFNQHGIMVYANKSFKKLYNSLNTSVKENFSQKLHDLDIDLRKSKNAFTKKQLVLSSVNKKIKVIVYLLNRIGSKKNFLLVMLKSRHFKKGSQTSTTIKTKTAYGRVKKTYSKNLSSAFSELIGEDSHFKAVLLSAQKAAKSDYPVLITGESGTGKEILARTIHNTSHRFREKFVDINCAALPDQLIDSELFGYEKGAFTGAVPGGRQGLIAEAHLGTLFLDEISDASLQTQAKLLRVLNEGHFKKIGGTKNIKVDVRIISATNKDLSQLIHDKRFREDLMYRLNTISIGLPPLRERPHDILLLANFFLKHHADKENREINLTARCLHILESYHWPGNVRELKGVIDYAVTMTNVPLITEDSFPHFLLPGEDPSIEDSEGQLHSFRSKQCLEPLSKMVQDKEKEVIRDVLQRAKNRSEAIKILGISRRTFYTKIKQYNLE